MKDGRAAVALSLLPWLALLGWLSAVAWFLCDDAFISFRYARNLLEGHGLVFNPGEYVEGYTNFLWILELAALWKVLGIPPEQAAPWLSVICTIGVLAALGTWLARLPALRHRWLVAWMAFGLLCSSATFAVWTSGGGLETRQFTLFIVVAVVCLSLWRTKRWGLVVASLSLALAAYTRPEGLLVGLVCIGWFVVQSMKDTPPPPDRTGGGWRDWGCSLLYWRRLAWLAVPFIVLVAAHYLFRYAYYGEWLPNTYYAKHVRPWYESGFRYLWAAALETGLYLILPLAAVAARQRWRAHRDGVFALPLLLVGVHMAYVMRIGGDHFEYRPLDFYWPLLAFPAAVGVVHLGARLAASRWRPRLPGMNARACALAVFVPVLFYAGAIQGALLFEGAEIRERIFNSLHIELDDENAGWLLTVPAMPMLVAVSNDLRRQLIRHKVATPRVRSHAFTMGQLRQFKLYENMERGMIPPDALTTEVGIGIRSYYLPDLKIIDRLGLTDHTIARNPVTKPNHEHKMAHDRRPPPRYLEERGVNITVHSAVNNQLKAFTWGHYAVQVGQDLWMPFDSPDEAWVLDRFAGRNLHVRDVYYAGLSWEQAVPDFDYRFGDTGFAVTGFLFLPWVYPKVQMFARNCAPDELLVWPWSNEKVDGPVLQHWTVNETGLCRATVRNREWIRSVVDDPSRLKKVKRVNNPAIRSVFDVYLLGNRLIYFKQPCRLDDNDALFFLHVFPADKRDLPRGRQKYGFDNLDFWMEKYTKVGGRCKAVRRLPDYPITKVHTGQYTDEGQLWGGTIVVAGSGSNGRPLP